MAKNKVLCRFALLLIQLILLSINKGKGESVLPDICKNHVIYYVVPDHRIMEVRRFFYKRLVFSDNRCSNRFFLVSAGIFVG